MEPDPSTPSRQGTGNKRADKTGKTVPLSDIPEDHQPLEDIDEGITEGANPGPTEPQTRHVNRPERKVEGGNYRGPIKRGDPG